MNRLRYWVLLGLAIGLAFVLALVALVWADRPAPPVPLTGIPNVERIYYDVSGRSVADIRRAIDGHASRPRDPNDGRRVDALASWYIRWSWPGAAGGGCDLARTRLEFSARITMPRLAGEADVPAPVLRQWRDYIAALERHESRHILYAWEHRGEVLAALRASSCARANDDAHAVIRRIGQHDIDYDRETRHGATEGSTFP